MDAKHIIEELKNEIERTELKTRAEETGRVLTVKDGVVRLSGLYPVGALELIEIRTATKPVTALALNIEAEEVGAVALGNFELISEGDEAVGTGQLLSVPAGEAFLGRVVSALGEPLYGKGAIKYNKPNPL